MDPLNKLAIDILTNNLAKYAESLESDEDRKEDNDEDWEDQREPIHTLPERVVRNKAKAVVAMKTILSKSASIDADDDQGHWYRKPENYVSMGLGAAGLGALGYGIRASGLRGFATGARDAFTQAGPKSTIETSKKVVDNLSTMIPFGKFFSGLYKGTLGRIESDEKASRKLWEMAQREAEISDKHLAKEEEMYDRVMASRYERMKDFLKDNPFATVNEGDYTFNPDRKYTRKTPEEIAEEIAQKIADQKILNKDKHIHRAMDVAIASTLAAGADIGMHKIYDHSHDDEAKKQRFHDYKAKAKGSLFTRNYDNDYSKEDRSKQASAVDEGVKETGRLRTILVEDVLKHGTKGLIYTAVPATIGYGLGRNVQGGYEHIERKDKRLADEYHLRKQASVKDAGRRLYSKLDRLLTTVDKEGNIHNLKEFTHGKDGIARSAIKAGTWIVPPAVITGIVGRNMRRGLEPTSVAEYEKEPDYSTVAWYRDQLMEKVANQMLDMVGGDQ